MIRVGFGYDVHRLVGDRKLVLAGVTIPAEKGALGHSDADALCHAIADALLGAAALGDLGSHFPDTDERFAGISSLLLLKQVKELLEEHGFEVGNVDATVVLESPKLKPYVPEMRGNLADCLGIPMSRVSVKATTSEKLGFVGEETGLSAYACVLIKDAETE